MRNRNIAIWTGAAVLLLALGVLALCLVRRAYFISGYEREHSLHSPVFSPDGKKIYFLSRKAAGLTFGPGAEHFTPPAKVIFFSDTLTLQSADVPTGAVSELRSWKIPHGRKIEEHYRNRVFGFPSSSLSWREDGKLVYLFGLDLFPDSVPYIRETEWLEGAWDPVSGVSEDGRLWEKAPLSPAPWPDEVLRGDYEVISFRNKAILIHDIKSPELTVLVASETARDLGEELKTIRLDEHSHRDEIEKRTYLRETREKLIRKFEAEGMGEGEALLRTGDELEKMGLYPKSPKITASRKDKPDGKHEVFHISSDEFRFGLFPDIEKAIKNEGQEIGFWGNYVRHNDFGTSEKLNTYLDAGHTSFFVETEGTYYLMTISR